MPEITWYQCSDLANFYAKSGHQSYRKEIPHAQILNKSYSHTSHNLRKRI